MEKPKLKHGGARPATRPDDKRKQNGARGEQGQGRPVRRITLSEKDAITCRILGYKTKEEIERFISSLVYEQWQAFDQRAQRHGEELAEAETCANA